MKTLLVVVVGLLIGIAIGRLQTKDRSPADEPTTIVETITVRDTVMVTEPAAIETAAVGKMTYIGRKAQPRYTVGCRSGLRTDDCDTMGYRTCLRSDSGTSSDSDSVAVELPIIQRHYRDSTYEAWVSGPVDPRLDSIKIARATAYVTRLQGKPPERWHIGLTTGVGYTPKGVQPYIGIGITYTLKSW